MVLSFLTVRRFVGALGIALPPGLLIGGLVAGEGFRPTISDYYHSSSPILHGIFVGTLSAVGVFLICYKGYERNRGDCLGDNWIANVAGFFALCIAIFPATAKDCELSPTEGIFGWVHDVATVIFFLVAAVMILWLFTKPRKSPNKEEERTQYNLHDLRLVYDLQYFYDRNPDHH